MSEWIIAIMFLSEKWSLTSTKLWSIPLEWHKTRSKSYIVYYFYKIISADLMKVNLFLFMTHYYGYKFVQSFVAFNILKQKWNRSWQRFIITKYDRPHHINHDTYFRKYMILILQNAFYVLHILRQRPCTSFEHNRSSKVPVLVSFSIIEKKLITA